MIVKSAKICVLLRKFVRTAGYCSQNQRHTCRFPETVFHYHKQSVVFNLFNFFKQELAIDLGTANTLIMVDDKVVVDEPSIVAIDRRTGNTIAVGHRAMQMV